MLLLLKILILFGASFISTASAAKILAVFMTPAYSHQVVFQPIWKELSLRGHEVTVLTPNPLRDATLTNLTEIDLSFSNDVWRREFIQVGNQHNMPMMKFYRHILEAYLATSEVQLAHPTVQQFIQNKDNRFQFDLLLVEVLFPSMYAFKDIYNCPMIGISSMELRERQNQYIGNPTHPVIHPDIIFPFSTNLSFMQRVVSTISFMLSGVGYQLTARALIEDHMQKYFGNIRSLSELASEFSLILASTNYALSNVRPTVPSYVELTGIHITPRKPLPKDLQQFLDEANEGVIYFSFGTNVNSSLVLKGKIDIIVETLSGLPYKVMWKFDHDNPPVSSKSILIRQWFPQQDVLAHKNVKLFITQGGAQSIDEAVHLKVPLLICPQLGDQFRNAHNMVQRGVAVSLNFLELTKTQLEAAILEVINNPKYKNNVDELSDVITDQPIPTLEKAVWWIEYVLRHNGANHLRYSAGLDIPFYQYYLLDVISFLFLSATIIVYIFYKIIRFSCFCKKTIQNLKKHVD